MRNIITIKKDAIIESYLYYARKNYVPSRSDKARKCQEEKIMHKAFSLYLRDKGMQEYRPYRIKELKHCYHVKIGYGFGKC